MSQDVQATGKRMQRWLLAILLPAFAAIAVVGYWFYAAQARDIRAEVEARVQDIARISAEQVGRWRHDQWVDAALLADSPFLTEGIVALVDTSDSGDRARLTNYFEQARELHNYEDLLVVDRAGEILFSLEATRELDAGLRQQVEVALRERRRVIFDRIQPMTSTGPPFAVITPIVSDTDESTDPSLALVLTNDPQTALTPRLADRPPSTTTLLARREADSVLILAGGASGFVQEDEIPLTASTRPLVRAAKGEAGIIEGRAADGTRVIAAVEPVKDSSWFVVHEVDVDQAFAAWRERSILILALYLAIAAIAIGLVGIAWWHRQRAFERATHQQLRANEARYRSIIDNAPYAVFIQGEGRFAYANSNCLALLDVEHLQDLRGTDVIDWFAPEFQEQVSGRIRQLNEDERAVDIAEEEIVSRTGERIPVEVAATPFRLEAKPGAVVFMRDIRRRKRTETIISRHLAMMSRTERLASIGSWEWDVARDEVTWSEELYRIFQMDPHRPPPSFRNHAAMFMPEDFDKLTRAVDAAVEQGTAYAEEVRVVRRDGELRHCVTRGEPEFGDDGAVIRLVGSFQDITELRAFEQQHRLLVEAVDRAVEAVQITDADGTIVYVNQAFTTNTGYTRDEVLGQKPSLLKSGVQGQAFYRRLWATLLSGEVWRGELVNRCKDGTFITEEATISPVRNAEGEITNFVAVKHDVTEKKHFESERRLLEDQFHEAQKMESIGRLAGGVAHDFNNMLGVILGYVELILEETPESDPRHADLIEVQSAAMRSSQITRQLLAFARKQKIDPRPIDLNETVGTMLRMLQRLIGEDVRLDWQPADALWPVRLDPHQINQLLVNLCVNARDAVEGHGTITIHTENRTVEPSVSDAGGAVASDYVLLIVSDDGVGMSDTTKRRMFEPFFTTKRAGEGTGLGLSTVYGIVRQNEGFIEVESQLALGTAVSIYIRRHDAQLGRVEPATAGEPTIGQGQTILLVEDEAAMLDVTARTLRHLGFNVLPAATAREARQFAHQHSEDLRLLLTDVVMPDQDGQSLAQEIRNIVPNVAVLYMSGYPDDVIETYDLEAERSNIIAKPFDIATLAKRLGDALSH